MVLRVACGVRGGFELRVLNVNIIMYLSYVPALACYVRTLTSEFILHFLADVRLASAVIYNHPVDPDSYNAVVRGVVDLYP